MHELVQSGADSHGALSTWRRKVARLFEKSTVSQVDDRERIP